MISDIHAKANCSPKATRGIEALLEKTDSHGEADFVGCPVFIG